MPEQDDFFAKYRTPAEAPPVTEPQSQQAQQPQDFFSKYRTTGPTTAPDTFFSKYNPETPQPKPSGDFFSKYSSTTPEWDANTPVSEQGATPSWYSRAWRFLNDPLWDVHRTFKAESGWGRGVENVVSSLSSPINLGLLALAPIGGEFGLAGTLAPALRAAGIARDTIPVVLKTGQILIDAGFNAQMIRGLAQEVPAFLDALKFGDYEKAKELAVESLATGGLTALGTRGIIRDAGIFYDAAKLKMPVAHIMAARRLIAEHLGNTQIHQQESQKLMQGLRDMLESEKKGLGSDKTRLAGIRTAAESGFDEDTLRAQHDFLSGVLPVSKLPIQAAELKPRIAPEWAENFNKVVRGVDRGQKGIIPVDETKLPTAEEMPTVGKAVYDVLARNYIEDHARRGIDVSKPDIEKVGLGHWGRAMMHLFPGVDMPTLGDLYKKVAIYGPGPQRGVIDVAELAAPTIRPEVAAEHIRDLHMRNDGATFNLHDGDMSGQEAYAVVTHPDETVKLDHAPTKEEIQGYITKKMGLLQDRNLSAGTWYDRANNTHELNVSSTPRSLEEAMRLASERGEKFIYDLKNNKEIPVTPQGMTEALLQRSELPEALQNPIKTAPIYSPAAAAVQTRFPGKVEEFQGKFYDKAMELLKQVSPEVVQFVDKVMGSDISLFASKGPSGISFTKAWLDSLIAVNKGFSKEKVIGAIAKDLAQRTWAPAEHWEEIINNVDKTGKPHITVDPIRIAQQSQTLALPAHTVESVLMHEAGHIFHATTAPGDFLKQVPMGKALDALALEERSKTTGSAGMLGRGLDLNEQIAEMFNLYSKEGSRKELTPDERNLIQALARHSGKPELEAFAKAKNVAEFMKTLNVRTDIQAAQLKPQEAGADIIDQLRDTYGNTENPREAKFVLPSGEMIGGGSSAEHDVMLQNVVNKMRQTDPSIQNLDREQFVNQEKVLRVRSRLSRGGEEIAFSLPRSGISDAQREMIRKATGQMSRTGNIYLEIADKGGPGKALPFPKVSEVDGHIDSLYKEFNKGHKYLQMAELRPQMPKREGYDKYYSEKEKRGLLDEYKAALKLSPMERKVAETIRGHFDNFKDVAQKNDIVEHFVDNYITRIWGERPDASNEPVNTLMHQNRSGLFSTNIAAAMHRMFHTTFEGRMAGFKTLTDDPIALLGHYHTTLKNAISARNMLDKMRDMDIRGMDGRPLATIAGTGKLIGEETGQASVIVNPFQKRSIRIAQERIEDMTKDGTLQQAIQKGFIKKLGEREKADGTKVPLYGWDTTGYKVVDSPIMRGWRYATHDTADDPAPVYMKGDLVVHPDIEKLVKTAIGAEKSPITQSKLGRLALRASSEGKHLLLSLSPFHIVQEGLRAIMSGVSPKPWDLNTDLSNDPVLNYGVKHGLTIVRDYRGIQDYMEGVGGNSAIINKLPGLRTIHNSMQEFLFDKYIPTLKARAYKSLVERYRRAYPDWDIHHVAEAAASHANEAFGGLQYKLLGRSLTTQSVMRLGLLAPDWLESQGRFIARALGPEGKIARTDLARISLYMFGAMRVLNLLTSGNLHMEAPFGVVVPGKKGEEDRVYSVRTIPTDLLHAVQNPRDFIMGRVNPLTVRTGLETLEGRDSFGRKVTPEQEAGDFMKNLAPIPTQATLKNALGQISDLSNTEQVAKALGASVYAYKTEASKLAQELASDRNESGPVPPEAQARHLRDIMLEDGLRQGTVSPLQVRQQLPKLEADRVLENVQLSSLQARVKRLPLHDALQVFEIAQQQEKQSLKEILWKKRLAWLDRHQSLRAKRDDPATWSLLKSIYPDLNALENR